MRVFGIRLLILQNSIFKIHQIFNISYVGFASAQRSKDEEKREASRGLALNVGTIGS